MKINSITISCYSWEHPHGSISLSDDGTNISLKLEESDVIEFQALAVTIFERRQAGIAERLAKMQVPALPKPDCVDAEFTD